MFYIVLYGYMIYIERGFNRVCINSRKFILILKIYIYLSFDFYIILNIF